MNLLTIAESQRDAHHATSDIGHRYHAHRCRVYPFLAEPTAFGQSRAVTLAPTTVNSVRDWDNAVDRLTRSRELVVRQERADTLVAGRSIEAC